MARQRRVCGIWILLAFAAQWRVSLDASVEAFAGIPVLATQKAQQERLRIVVSAGIRIPKVNNNDNGSIHSKEETVLMDRKIFTERAACWAAAGLISSMVGDTTLLTPENNQKVALAAPPIAVIAEELGYFPVRNANNETVFVPKRVQRVSSEQAIALAEKLREAGAVIYTAYWCPHCARQKELLGREAWQVIRNVECSPKGYGAQPAVCLAKNIDGYPTWVFPKTGKRISGERPLSELAKAVGFDGFDESLELNVPPPLGASACK